MKRFYLLLLLCTAISLWTSAQIGYQVSLLNNATGEPRANERVTVTVKITDSEGKTVCEETKNETSNDFGVLSMTVGDSEKFTNADWSKLPFFIEASVDGRMLGKSQLLSVPIAEHAKHTGILSKELLCSKEWKHYEDGKLDSEYKFHNNYKYISICYNCDRNETGYIDVINEGIYGIEGNTVSIVYPDMEYGTILQYDVKSNCLIDGDGPIYR